MSRLQKLFGKIKTPVIGMIHVPPLPGTPLCKNSVGHVMENCLNQAEILKKCGIEGIMIENMFDVPYIKASEFTPELTAIMSVLGAEIRKICPKNVPCGVQILAAGNKEALAVALAGGLQFIRAEGFIFAHVADEGFTDANAGSLLRYRRQIGAEHIQIFADIKKKHSSHAITSDVSILETAQAAELFLADGVIVTGTATGAPADARELNEVKTHTSLPVLVGSGVTIDNVTKYLSADALIVGSHFKVKGIWKNSLDVDRISRFMDRIRTLREKCADE